MEAALSYHFGYEISTEMLQLELDRMAHHSKVPQRLIELFEIFENDPTTLAECIARPALVKKNIYDKYYWNTELHSQVRELAERYQQHTNANLPSSTQHPKEQHLVFEIQNDPDKNDEQYQKYAVPDF